VFFGVFSGPCSFGFDGGNLWSRRSPTRVSKSRRRSKVDPVRVPEVEAKSNSSSSPVRRSEAVCNKTDAQIAY
jgi:hypothetical protein